MKIATTKRFAHGNGAVRLLLHDAQRHALLLERCVPGEHLATVDGVAALDVLVELLPRLWVSAGSPFDLLADEAVVWTEHLGDPARTTGVAPDLVDVAIVRSIELGRAHADVLYRLDRLCADLDLDRDRARGWTIAQTVPWTSDSTQPEWCDQLVRRLLAA